MKKKGKQDELNRDGDEKSVYEEAEQHYTKVTRGYLFSWYGIVALYGVILIVPPIRDILHGRMEANNWATLFKMA